MTKDLCWIYRLSYWQNWDFISFSGTPQSERAGPQDLLDKESFLQLSWNRDELEDFICGLFPNVPQLDRFGFDIAKCSQGKLLIKATDHVLDSANKLRKFVVKGKIYTLPKRPLLIEQVKHVIKVRGKMCQTVAWIIVLARGVSGCLLDTVFKLWTPYLIWYLHVNIL